MDIANHDEMRETLQKRTHALAERVKELTCLYGISKLIDNRNNSLEEILQGTVDLIPPAWQYPEVTCARITLGNQTFVTSDFKDTPWQQAANILVQGKPMGSLVVCYLEARPEWDEGPFLREERDLIDAIAERLGRVTERIQAEEALQAALKEAHERGVHAEALLRGARSVLENRKFEDAARAIFEAAESAIGATAGYVALLSEDGTENEVLFLDPGGLPCTVDSTLPMPIRGLRAEAYHTGETVYDNDFSQSAWAELLPAGHATLHSVMFAPLTIEAKVVGLLGLANKPGGFTEDDAHTASAFGQLAAIALHNSRTLEALASSEEHSRSVVQTASDAIITVNGDGEIVAWNQGAQRIFGHAAEESIGQPLSLILPEAFREAHAQGLQRVVTTGQSKIIGTTMQLAGLRKDGSEFPIELSLAKWQANGNIFFTGILRDISERKRAEEEREQLIADLNAYAHTVAHDLKNPVNIVRGYTEFLLDSLDSTPQEELAKALQEMRRSTASMQDIIDNLLLLASVRQKDEVVTQPLDMAQIVAKVQERLAFMLEDLEAKIVLPAAWPEVHGHAPWIEEVWFNYLNNALKYGGRPPRIELGGEARSGQKEARFWVRDNGPGLTPEEQAQVFTPFTRLHHTKAEGHGLGLSIVERIVTKLGGKVGVESAHGEGATFWFTLPTA